MNDNQLILNELRAFFKSKKISQKEVAENIGKKQSYINYILTGKVNITHDTAQLLHDAYGFSKEFLLFGTGKLFADASGVARNTIYNIENCRNVGSLDILFKLLNSLNATMTL